MKLNIYSCISALAKHVLVNPDDLAARIVLGFFQIYSGDGATGCKTLYDITAITNDTAITELIICELSRHPQLVEIEGAHITRTLDEIQSDLLLRIRIPGWEIKDIKPWQDACRTIPDQSRTFITALILKNLEYQHHPDIHEFIDMLLNSTSHPVIVQYASLTKIRELILKASRILASDDYSESQQKSIAAEKADAAFKLALKQMNISPSPEIGNLLDEALELGFKSNTKLAFDMMDALWNLETDNPSFLLKRVYIFLNHGRYKEAEKEINRLISVFGNGQQAAEALFLKGRLYQKKKKYNKADKLFLQVISLPDAGPVFDAALEAILVSAEKMSSTLPSSAITLLRKAALKSPEGAPKLLYAAAQIYLDNRLRYGERKSKIKAAELFRQLCDEYPDAHESFMARRRLESFAPFLKSSRKTNIIKQIVAFLIVAVGLIFFFFF